MTMGFNLIKDTMEGGTYKFSTLDSSIATVDENRSSNSTRNRSNIHKKYTMKKNDIWAAVE